MQLDEAERGFAYAQDAPLDMRMDQTRGLTAAEVLNTYRQRAGRILGSTARSGSPADRHGVVRERAREPFTTTARSPRSSATPSRPPTRRTGGNPAKRTFQALRIEVNGELRCSTGPARRAGRRWPSAAGSS